MPAERGGDPHQPPRASPAALRRPAKTKFSDGGNTSFLSPHAARPAPPARRRTPGLPRPSAHRSGSLTSSSAPREAAARRFAPATPASRPPEAHRWLPERRSGRVTGRARTAQRPRPQTPRTATFPGRAGGERGPTGGPSFRQAPASPFGPMKEN